KGELVRRVLAGLAVLVAVALAYAVGDVYDVVPGILTRDRPIVIPTATSTSGAHAVAFPAPDAMILPLAPAGTTSPVPTTAGLTALLRHALAEPALGASVGVEIRDALTGDTLYTHQAQTPRLAASTQKMLAAAAITSTTDLSRTMTTRVVGEGLGQIALVAGGDTMLARGAGDPFTAPGRAGLGDLAAQVAGALRAAGETKVSLRLDLSYAAGPAYAPAWQMADVHAGATQGVFMIGLADERPEIGHASPPDPPSSVAKAFVKDLAGSGITATLTPRKTWATAAPAAAPEFGSVSSAPVGEVLSTALDDSDNALTENLTRQAAVGKGGPATFAGATAYQTTALKALAVDLAGVSLSDASGLSRTQHVSVRAIADVMALATTGRLPGLQQIVAELPVAGLTGTLHDRFEGTGARQVAGIPRSKTGTLIGSSGMAGTTVDTDGRLLSYVMVADHVPASQGTLAARAALDRLVAGLTACGCRS
ncbi:MAG: D-alanyl-D-alanine carboxypeptidase, partial [Nostocoides sp.]